MKIQPIKTGILAFASTTLAAPTQKSCSSLSSVSLTFYGYPDNDPPSADIAWDCGRGYTAGGNGTYTNPLTVATAPGEFNECEILYLPYLQKYLIVEDTCASCIRDWAKEPKEHHIDVWMESGKGENPGKVLGCEEGLTPKRGVSVVREPGEEYGVDDSLLWEGGSCLTGNTYGAMDVPGCSRVETNGGVQTPTQESSATRTMARPTTPRTSTSTSTSTTTTTSTSTDKAQQGSGFGMQAGLGWMYAVVLGVYFCM